MKHLTVCRFLAMALGFASVASAADTWELQTRPGVTQPVLVEAPSQPKAAVILFAGGNGGVLFAGDEPTTYRANFLVRSRAEFVKQGFVVATFGAPSDKVSPRYLDDNFRKSQEHANDILAVVGALRKRFAVPVWLVGTSRGTFSAAAAGLHLGKAVDGVILTATMADVVDLPIDRFEVPVLMAHHSLDRCRDTYFREARSIKERLKAPRSELLSFNGGKEEGPPCQAMAYHGFNGIEPEVVAAIAKWTLGP